MQVIEDIYVPKMRTIIKTYSNNENVVQIYSLNVMINCLLGTLQGIPILWTTKYYTSSPDQHRIEPIVNMFQSINCKMLNSPSIPLCKQKGIGKVHFRLQQQVNAPVS